MAELRIPPRFRPALIQLAEKNDESIDELCSLLESNPDILTSRQIALEHANKLVKFGADEGFAVVEALIPLMFTKATYAPSTAELVRDITKSLKSGDKGEPKLPSLSVSRFQVILTRILDLSSIALKAKALSLAADCQRLFTDAKIISDMRPVFGRSVTEPPLGVVVLHSLRIDFSEDGSEREFFVHMDSKDLQELQACVTRALDKDASIRRLVDRSKLQVFNTRGDNEK